MYLETIPQEYFLRAHPKSTSSGRAINNVHLEDEKRFAMFLSSKFVVYLLYMRYIAILAQLILTSLHKPIQPE